MQKFPHLTRLEDVLPHIDGRKEFYLAERAEFLIVDYNIIDNKTFVAETDSPEALAAAAVRRECRGLKFDKSTRRLLARPYHKFFNVGEREDLLPEAIDWRRDHVVLEKLDGSMVHAVAVESELLFATRMGATPTARRARAHAEAHPEIDYVGFCRALLADGLTPIFEWCSQRDRIVIGYEQDELVLTAAREIASGAYLSWAELQRLASNWALPLVTAHPLTVEEPLSFIDGVRSLEDTEGRVLRFADGDMLKLKTETYALKHSLLANIQSEKFAVKVILQGKDDDAAAMLPPPQAQALSDFAAALRSGLTGTAERLEAFVEAARAAKGDDKKAFALAVQAELPKRLQAAAFKLWLGEEAVAALTGIALRGLKSQTAVDAARPLWGEAKWADYLPESGALKESS